MILQPNKHGLQKFRRKQKGARVTPRALVQSDAKVRRSAGYSLSFLVFFLSAAPRMSPREAPESDEPNCATASFSSATSRALIEAETLRVALSTEVTITSTLSP